MDKPGYFTQFTYRKALLYIAAAAYVVSAAIVAVLEPYMNLPCDDEGERLEFPNPAFDSSPCRNMRYAKLLFFTPEECGFARRLVMSILLGGFIGWERREADRPAGIRTMSLVSLGSCLFTIDSSFAFLDGPMGWDASRVSAAIPSGVGFLGAGLIFKNESTTSDGQTNHIVHGLTTASAVWLSAAVGIACGGELYFAASFGTALMMLLLRFGPRHPEPQQEQSGGGMDGELECEKVVDDALDKRLEEAKVSDMANYSSVRNVESEAEFSEETRSLLSQRTSGGFHSVRTRPSVRNRVSLASMV